MNRKHEGVFRQELRRMLQDYKRTKNLYRLCMSLLSLMKRCKFSWQYYYILENFPDVFKDVFPEEYIVETL